VDIKCVRFIDEDHVWIDNKQFVSLNIVETIKGTYIPETNADCIRHMSAIEMADLFGLACPPPMKTCNTKICRDCWLDWLNEKVRTKL
jgi:hypothetical protein